MPDGKPTTDPTWELGGEFPEDNEEDFDPGDECGRWNNGKLTQQCRLAGSEFCDWDCPYGD